MTEHTYLKLFLKSVKNIHNRYLFSASSYILFLHLFDFTHNFHFLKLIFIRWGECRDILNEANEVT